MLMLEWDRAFCGSCTVSESEVQLFSLNYLLILFSPCFLNGCFQLWCPLYDINMVNFNTVTSLKTLQERIGKKSLTTDKHKKTRKHNFVNN